jgi:hypothetical protein
MSLRVKTVFRVFDEKLIQQAVWLQKKMMHIWKYFHVLLGEKHLALFSMKQRIYTEHQGKD